MTSLFNKTAKTTRNLKVAYERLESLSITRLSSKCSLSSSISFSLHSKSQRFSPIFGHGGARAVQATLQVALQALVGERSADANLRLQLSKFVLDGLREENRKVCPVFRGDKLPIVKVPIHLQEQKLGHFLRLTCRLEIVLPKAFRSRT